MPDPIEAVDGKLWATMVGSSRHDVYDFKGKSIKIFPEIIDKVNGSLAYSSFHGQFYDFNGAIDMPSLTVTSDATVVDFSDFSEAGYAWLTLHVKDGDTYFTFIDRQGKEQFPPKQYNSSYVKFYTDSYAVYDKDTNTVTIYDYTGAEKASVTAPQITGVTSLRENYFIANGQYFFF